MRRSSLIAVLLLPGFVSAAQLGGGLKFELRLAQFEPAEGLEEAAVQNSTTNAKIYVQRESLLTNADLIEARARQGDPSSGYFIEFVFGQEGARKLLNATESHTRKPLAVMIDGKVVAAPVVEGKLYDRAALLGRLKKDEAERIAAGIKGGATARVLRVSVRGRVTRQPMDVEMSRVRLTGDLESLPDATIHENGSFEFPSILPGAYILKPILDGILLPSTSIVVPTQDLTGLSIAIPPMKEVQGRVVVQGDGPMPRLPLQWRDASGDSSLRPAPRRDGTFTLTLPVGEGRLTLIALFPEGYTVNAFTYGSTDLRTYGDPNNAKTIRISANDPSELRVNFATAPNSFFRVGGRVIGVDPAHMPTVSIKAYAFSDPNLETSIRPDGTFEFSKIFRGNYTLVAGDPATGLGGAVGVDVVDRDITNVELLVPASLFEARFEDRRWLARLPLDIRNALNGYHDPRDSVKNLSFDVRIRETARGQSLTIEGRFYYEAPDQFRFVPKAPIAADNQSVEESVRIDILPILKVRLALSVIPTVQWTESKDSGGIQVRSRVLQDGQERSFSVDVDAAEMISRVALSLNGAPRLGANLDSYRLSHALRGILDNRVPIEMKFSSEQRDGKRILTGMTAETRTESMRYEWAYTKIGDTLVVSTATARNAANTYTHLTECTNFKINAD